MRVLRQSAVKRSSGVLGPWKICQLSSSLKTTSRYRPSLRTLSPRAALNRLSPHSGEEAVTLLKGSKGNYRALVADIRLRGRMDGWEVAKHAREIDPEFPIIYMTGINGDEWGSRGVPNSILMTKPFAPAQLVTALSRLLNSGTATT